MRVKLTGFGPLQKLSKPTRTDQWRGQVLVGTILVKSSRGQVLVGQISLYHIVTSLREKTEVMREVDASWEVPDEALAALPLEEICAAYARTPHGAVWRIGP